MSHHIHCEPKSKICVVIFSWFGCGEWSMLLLPSFVCLYLKRLLFFLHSVCSGRAADWRAFTSFHRTWIMRHESLPSSAQALPSNRPIRASTVFTKSRDHLPPLLNYLLLYDLNILLIFLWRTFGRSDAVRWFFVSNSPCYTCCLIIENINLTSDTANNPSSDGSIKFDDQDKLFRHIHLIKVKSTSFQTYENAKATSAPLTTMKSRMFHRSLKYDPGWSSRPRSTIWAKGVSVRSPFISVHFIH